jgi:hypothetical protein
MFPTMIVALLVARVPVQAQTLLGKAEKLQGTWVLKALDHKTTIEIKPDVLRCTLFIAKEGCTVIVASDYVLREDGILFCIRRMHQAGNKKHTADNLEDRVLSCRIAVHKNTLIISGVEEGRGVRPCGHTDISKFLKGVYRKEKDKEPAKAEQGTPTMTPVLPGSTTSSNDQSSISSAIETFFTKVGEVLGVQVYSSDPKLRMTELMNQSEGIRELEEEWEKVWRTDHPSHLKPERVEGFIAPN